METPVSTVMALRAARAALQAKAPKPMAQHARERKLADKAPQANLEMTETTRPFGPRAAISTEASGTGYQASSAKPERPETVAVVEAGVAPVAETSKMLAALEAEEAAEAAGARVACPEVAVEAPSPCCS
jgi:hypothetical protein